MNCESYLRIKWLKKQCNYKYIQGKISTEDLLEFYNVDNLEKVEQFISSEEISFVEEWIESERNKEMSTEDVWLDEDEDKNTSNYLRDKIQEDYEKMTPEEITQNIKEYIDNNIFDEDVFETLPEPSFLLEEFKNYDIATQDMLARFMKEEDVFEYINDNGKSSEAFINYFSKIKDNKFLNKTMESLTSDFNRAKILLLGDNVSFLPYIEDQYYRTQIVKSNSEFNFDKTELLEEMEEYNLHLDKLMNFKDEEEKTTYLSTVVTDRDMKQALLTHIKEKENRDTVVKSFERTVDPEIASLDNLTQTMIREYFEDTLGDKFTDDKKERLEIIFNRSDVKYANLEQNVNGRANHIYRDIIISNRHKENTNRNLGFLVHEYAHSLSLFDYAYTKNIWNHTAEEGMADLLGDLVINHYLDKHKDIELDGKKVRIDKPYATYSGYNFENGWIRTMIGGLENSGKDSEAVAEYVLGDKLKFMEMVFGKEFTQTKDVTYFGMPNMEVNRADIYDSPELDFSYINKDSIYYKRNFILPLFEIQNKLEDKADVVGCLSEGKSYYANYVANQYFDGKKFYEVPKEEFEEFIELLHAQITPRNQASAIIDISKYKNQEIDKLTEDEIKDNSFEILKGITILWGKDKNLNAGTNLERVIEIAFKEETDKIEKGQSIETTMQKKDAIVEKYMKMFSSETENNMYINDCINDYCFKCEQVELEQKNNSQTLLNMDTIKSIAKAEGVPQKKSFAIDRIAELQIAQDKDISSDIQEKE